MSESHARRAGLLQAGILIAAVICSTLPMIIGPVLPAIQAHFQSVPGIIALVPMMVTLPSLVMALLSAFVGAAADRWGRKRLLIAALLIYGLVGTAPLYLNSIYAILASRAVVGIAEAVAMTLSTVLLGDYFEGARRDLYIAIQTAIASISGIVISLLGGALGSFGWRTPFAVYLVMLLLVPLALMGLWEPPHQQATASAELPAGHRWWRHYPLLLAVSFAVGLVLMLVPLNLSYLLVDAGIASAQASGFAYALACAGAVSGTMFFGGFVARRYSAAGQFCIAALFAAAGSLLISRASSFWGITMAATIVSFGVGISLPAATSWALCLLPLHRRGVGVGGFMACQFMGMFCSPLLFLAVMAIVGRREAAAGVCGYALVVVALAAGITALRHRRGIQSPAR